MQREEIRLHLNGNRIARPPSSEKRYNVQACNIRREGRRERGRIREGRTAALGEPEELPEVVGAWLRGRAAAGQRDHGAQLNGLIRAGVTVGVTTGGGGVTGGGLAGCSACGEGAIASPELPPEHPANSSINIMRARVI